MWSGYETCTSLSGRLKVDGTGSDVVVAVYGLDGATLRVSFDRSCKITADLWSSLAVVGRSWMKTCLAGGKRAL
jgi:hypothetical protein